MENKIRFFGRRKSKPIRATRQVLLEELLPKISLDAHKLSHIDTMFGITPKEIWLEIGFGGGEHLAQMCAQHHDIGFIGAEPFLNGVSSLLSHLNGSYESPKEHTGLDEKFVDNIRIYPNDIRQIFSNFKDKSIQKIYILYPDPWPKTRHTERRFFNQDNLRELARILADEGTIELATDMPFYIEHALEQIKICDRFIASEVSEKSPDDWITTRYEQKALRAGRIPQYVQFKKKGEKLP